MDILSVMKQLNQRRIKVKIIVDVVIWLSVGLSGFYLFLQATPHEQGFFCHDISLSYPYKKDTVSTSMLITIGILVSSFIVVFVEVLNCADGKCRRTCLCTETAAYCIKRYALFLVGIAIQLLIVEVIKNMMGVLRPNFFDVCKPVFNTSLCPSFITEYKCFDKEVEAKEIRNSRQSFPSGHSAFSMYIAAFFCTTLIFLSLLCGLGRIRDHKHHVSDVIAGFAIGLAVGTAVYKIVCVDNLEDTSGRKSCLTDSENFTVQSDMCISRDHFPGEESFTPTPLLINEKFADATNTQTPLTPHIPGFANDGGHTLNAASDRHVV